MRKFGFILVSLTLFFGCADTENNFGEGKYVLTDSSDKQIKFSIDDEKIVFDGGNEYAYDLVEGTQFIDAENWQLGIGFDGERRQIIVRMEGDNMMGLSYLVVESGVVKEHWLYASTDLEINAALSSLPVNIKSLKYRGQKMEKIDLN